MQGDVGFHNYCDLSSRRDRRVPHHWAVCSKVWLWCQCFLCTGPRGAASLLLQLSHWQQSVCKWHKTVFDFIYSLKLNKISCSRPSGTKLYSLQELQFWPPSVFYGLILWGLSGWRSLHVQLQPDCDTWRKGGHLCLEQDLFSRSPLVSQRGYLWAQLHGSKLGYIL